jgi:CRP/FNR family transcriptional regulator, cyclic AMP receptor protein
VRSHCGLKVVESRAAPLARQGESFSRALVDGLRELDIIVPPISYPKAAVLFLEGQKACGIFAVCSGQVKLSTSSPDGKTMILKVAGAGDLLGLPSTLSGKPYEVSAEVSERAHVNFIPRAAFLRYMRTNPQAFFQVAQLLTESHYAGHRVIQSLALSHSAAGRLAQFLLGWSTDHARGQDHLQIPLTQEEIGEMTGITRETVTRMMASFKKKNLLRVDGVTVNICNRAALQGLAST